MRVSAASLLRRHAETLHGRLRRHVLRSAALGVSKAFYVYEPPGYTGAPLPVTWLLRGHEREWANPLEDRSRGHGTAVEDIDRAIATGRLPPLVLVLPGLTTDNNFVHGLGIDMAAPDLARPYTGLGSGRLWQYLDRELIPWVEARYPATQRLAAGFSLGGYTATLLAFGRPGWLDVAAFYDALFCWPEHDDPRVDGRQRHGDRIWGASPVLSAAFGWPRDADALDRWNTTDWLLGLGGDALDAARQTRYRVQCAGADGSRGNRDRAHAFVGWLDAQGMPRADVPVVFDAAAEHTWHWADRFLYDTLRDAFGLSPWDGPDRAAAGNAAH